MGLEPLEITLSEKPLCRMAGQNAGGFSEPSDGGNELMDQATESSRVFQAPTAYVILFYLLLLAWTVGTVPLIYLKFQQGGFQGDWVYAVMIGFFYLYTWFWSLGLFYRIALDGEGRIVLRSLRRNLEVTAKQIRTIEGSRFPGRVRFYQDEAAPGERLSFLPWEKQGTGGDSAGDPENESPGEDRPDIAFGTGMDIRP